MPSHLIATCFAIVAFATALVVGLAAQNPTLTILYRATLALFFCYSIGRIFGYIAQKAVDENVEQVKEANPILKPGASNTDQDDDDMIIAQPITSQSNQDNQSIDDQSVTEQSPEQAQNETDETDSDENKQAA